MKRILVTGGAGFLGSHICEKLVYDGHDVICIDNLTTGFKKNIEELLPKYNFEFIRHDITQPIILEVDQIYNLACPASPVHYQSDPVQTLKANVHGSINMLGLAKRTGAKVLQASTSEVYGDPTIHPQPENYVGSVNPIGPRACYDEGKRAAETLFFDYHRQHHVNIRIVRIFNTYGPRMSIGDGRVVSNFIIQCLKGHDITVYGDGSQTRSFCYVDDLVNGIFSLMNNKDKTTGPINMGNTNELSMVNLAELVIKLTKSKSKIIFKDLPKDDPKKRRPDISLAKKYLGWSPQIDIEDGLNRTIDYFSNLLSK